AEVHLPPRVGGVLLGMGLAAVGVAAAPVAVDGLAGVAAVGGVLLRRPALAGDVAAVAGDLHLGQGQRPPLAGQLDADEAADHALDAPAAVQLLRHAAEEPPAFRTEGGTLA